MNNIKKIGKVNKFIIYFLFITYITLYIFQLTGYYEYELNRKKVLTESQIEQFEEDIKAGNQIDAKEYITDHQTYNNYISKIGYNTSSFLSNITEKTIVSFFKIISNFVEE